MSKDIFENLVTDITAQVLQQVQTQIAPAVVDAVNNRIEKLINADHVNKTIDDRINRAVINYHPDMSVVEKNIETLTTQWSKLVAAELNTRVDKIINDKISSVDLNGLITSSISSKLDPTRQTYPFPNKSIDINAIDTTTLNITGDQISGGVIKNFGSTGLDDQATECRVTILDQGTVFENTLYAPRLEVKGGALIDGDLEIQGRIVDTPAYQQLVADVADATKDVITDDVLQNHQTLIFERIAEEGIDLAKLTFNGRVLVDGDRLVGVVNSQLRTVGILQDLQTSGETFLSDTFYVSKKRVGVNTMEPRTALSVWDEDVEIGIGKQERGVGRIAVERDTTLVLGSNNNDNITIKTDGSTVIPKLQINNMMFTSSATPPSYSANKGTVVFNENPSLGGPLGWVSLGDARWANFGIID